MFILLSGTDPGGKFKVKSINVHKSNKRLCIQTTEPTSQVDKHPAPIYTDRDAIYLDPNYR